MEYRICSKNNILYIYHNEKLIIIITGEHRSAKTISYSIHPKLYLIIGIERDHIIICDSKPQNIKMFMDSIKIEHFRNIIDGEYGVDYINKNCENMILETIKYFEQFKSYVDLLLVIHEIYGNSEDIDSVKQFLCKPNNVKSARK
jgi:hypothetical protein